MYKNFFIIIFFSFFFWNSAISKENKVVYVNMDKIINQSIAGKDLLSKREKQKKKDLLRLEKKEKEIKKEEKDIIQKKNILAKPDLEKKFQSLKKKVEEYKKNVDKAQIELNKKRNESTIKLVSIINNILANYADKNSISLILNKNSIIVGKSELDISVQILEIINEQTKSININ